jgi:hypothetical protein
VDDAEDDSIVIPGFTRPEPKRESPGAPLTLLLTGLAFAALLGRRRFR